MGAHIPNWCLNKVLIKVPSNQLLKQLSKALNSKEELFNKHVPRTPETSEHQNYSE